MNVTPRSHPLLRSQIGSRWVWMSVLALLFFAATYLLLVRTYLGQYLENAALLGAKENARASEVADALDNLQIISVVSLGIAFFAFLIVGLIRGSLRLGIAAAGALATSTLLAEVLKRYILSRPDLAPIYQDNAHNSFPSGHTTIAMAILVSLLLVIAYRWRGLVMLLAMGWAVSVGAATITARWHRLSDTIGGDMIAIGIGAVFALWLLRSGLMEPRNNKVYPLRVAYVVALLGMAFLSLVAGAILIVGTLNNFGVFHEIAAGNAADLTAHLDPVFNANMFYAAQTLAFGFSALAGLWFWATLHHLGTSAHQ